MRIDFIGKDEEIYLRNCIRTCQKKSHIQQVVFSTYHDCLTQICFTCNVLRTSLSHAEVLGTKKGNQPLGKSLDNAENTKSELNSQHREVSTKANGLYSTTDISGLGSHNVCQGNDSPPADTQIQNEINKDYEEQ